MLNAKLVVIGGDAKKAEVRLKLPTIIGRGKEAGLTVPHALVSRQHTEIVERDGRLFVRDMGSLNGTYVNNTRIEGEQPLEPNQLLTLGNITFRAVYEIQSNAAVGTESDAVEFEEVKADVDQAARDSIEVKTPAGKEQLSSISDVMSFDETVPVDLISSKSKQVVTSKPESKAKKTEPKKPAAAADERPTEPDLFQEDSRAESAAADTDKSFVHRDTTPDGSAIGNSFSIESDDIDPASKSVSASALNNLPATQAAASFVNFDAGDEGNSPKPVSQIDPEQLDLGEEENKAGVDVDSTLGSFLKKLPR